MNEKFGIKNLLKAQNRFKKFFADVSQEVNKLASVKAFEYCLGTIEDIFRKVLYYEGISELHFYKDLYRYATQMDLIDDPEVWFKFIELRRKTDYIYDDLVLQEVIDGLQIFAKEFDKAIDQLQKLFIFDKDNDYQFVETYSDVEFREKMKQQKANP